MVKYFQNPKQQNLSFAVFTAAVNQLTVFFRVFALCTEGMCQHYGGMCGLHFSIHVNHDRPEDGGSMFLRNVRTLIYYTVQNPTRRPSTAEEQTSLPVCHL
jgi:hypothetical protein